MKLAVDKIKSWVFVTGVPRSGTTFVGKILSLPLEVDYIHEPFNPQCGLPGITQWYRYVRPSLDTQEMQYYHKLTKKIFSYDLTLRSKIPQNDPWLRQLTKRIIGSRGPFFLRFAKLNPFHKVAVIKDPIGVLLTEYLYVRFQVKPIIIIKHPTSFIASIKRVNFCPSPCRLKDQLDLIEDYFACEAELFSKDWQSPVLAAAAFWRIIYKVLLAQASKYPDWQVITHEELCQDPVAVFSRLYQTLDLPWSESIKRKIVKLTQTNDSGEARKGLVQDFQRNSAEIFKMRRDSVSLEERKAIFQVVHDVALKVYSRESFAID